MWNPIYPIIPGRATLRIEMRGRLRAAGVHLLISAFIAALAAGLVFGIWYPGQYRLLAGGRDLFLLLTSVDVILGPLLTFTVFNVAKAWPHLRRDLVVIGLIQTAALGYGLHTVFVVRPVATVLEGSRFRILSAQDVLLSELPEALPEYRALPLTGPWLLGTRGAKSAGEANDALFLAVKGADIGQRPRFWQPYSESSASALAKSRPLQELLAHYPERAKELTSALQDSNIKVEGARFLPVVARDDWSAVIDSKGMPVGYLPVSGFF
jgi:hypothetical protein